MYTYHSFADSMNNYDIEDKHNVYMNRSDCSKADEENCLVKYGDQKCDCRASINSCFLPNLPSVRLQ
jgi:hypothetical protein